MHLNWVFKLIFVKMIPNTVNIWRDEDWVGQSLVEYGLNTMMK